MGALIDGWNMLQQHFGEVLLVAACVLWGGVLALRIVRGNFTLAEGLSLGAGLWALPALLLFTLALLTERLAGSGAAARWMALLAALIAVPAAWRSSPATDTRLPSGLRGAAALVGIAVILSVLRMAFLDGLLLPQYVDSATHYGLVRQLQEWAQREVSVQQLTLPSTPYYHLGYHALLAGMVGATNLDIAGLMLVSGQVLLTLLPIALYALARRLSGSESAALLAVVFAAGGWYMPAFAANWGKYPALLGMLLTIGALTLGHMAWQGDTESGARKRLSALSALVALAACLAHTRALVIILAASAAFVLARRLRDSPVVVPRLAAGTAALMVVILALAISGQPALRPVLEPYVGRGLAPTLAVCALGAIALALRPLPALTILLFLGFLLAGLVVPVPWGDFGTVLDRPLVEMWIFAPLSLLGAVGLASLGPFLGAGVRRAAAVTLAVALGLHALSAYDLRASSCCTIVTPADMAALQWLKGNLTEQDVVGIAAESLPLGSGPSPSLHAPVDAGAWIYPLTRLAVAPLPHDLDLTNDRAHTDLCQRGVRYLYVGASGRGFDAALLRQHLGHYAVRLLLPGASVFELINCTT